MRTPWFTCRRQFSVRRGNSAAVTALSIIGGLLLNAWPAVAPARPCAQGSHPDAPVLTASAAPQVFAAVIQESGKLKYFARAFQRLNPRFRNTAAIKPFRPSHAGDGPVISRGIGPFFQAANHLAFLRVDLPPPSISAHLT